MANLPHPTLRGCTPASGLGASTSYSLLPAPWTSSKGRQALVRSTVVSAQNSKGPMGPSDTSRVVVRLHPVQPGETLNGIATKYNIPVTEIMALSNKTTDRVYSNEVLYLPAAVSRRAVAAQHDLACIQLTPEAKLVLRKVGSEAGSASAATNQTTVAREIQKLKAIEKTNAVAATASSQAHAAATSKVVAKTALFASVQSSPNPVHKAIAAGLPLGLSSVAGGAGMLLIGSASLLKSLRKALTAPLQDTGSPSVRREAAFTQVLGLLKSLQGSLAPRQQVQGGQQGPAYRAAKRFLQELRSGNVARIGKARTAHGAAKLGIPTGEEVVLRRTGPRDLVADLRRRDSSRATDGVLMAYQGSLVEAAEAGGGVHADVEAWMAVGEPVAVVDESRMLPERTGSQEYWAAVFAEDLNGDLFVEERREVVSVPLKQAKGSTTRGELQLQRMVYNEGGTAARRGSGLRDGRESVEPSEDVSEDVSGSLRQRPVSGLPLGLEWPMGSGQDEGAEIPFDEWSVGMAKEANRMVSSE